MSVSRGHFVSSKLSNYNQNKEDAMAGVKKEVDDSLNRQLEDSSKEFEMHEDYSGGGGGGGGGESQGSDVGEGYVGGSGVGASVRSSSGYSSRYSLAL